MENENEEIRDFLEEELIQLEVHEIRAEIINEIGIDTYRRIIQLALESVNNEESSVQ
jgi:hypothetical protein